MDHIQQILNQSLTATIYAKKKMDFSVSGHRIIVEAGCLFQLIHSDRTDLILRNLNDRKRSSLKLQIKDKTVTLAPAQQLVVGDKQINAEVACRQTYRLNIPGISYAEISEISIPWLILQDATLLSMVHSKLPVDKRIIVDTIKTSASLMVITGNKGPYVFPARGSTRNQGWLGI